MKLSQVLQPAIRVAQDGFVIGANFHRINTENEAKFARFSSTSQLYLHAGKALPQGSLFRNPALAQTYRLLAQGGADAFYHGDLAQDVIKTVNQPPAAPGVEVTPGQMSWPTWQTTRPGCGRQCIRAIAAMTCTAWALPAAAALPLPRR